MSVTPRDYAARYIERFHLALVPLPPATKAPLHQKWNDDAQLIRTVEAATAHWRRHPSDGMGACLEPSGLVSLDADYIEGAREVLAAESIDLDALIGTTPTIVGRAPRLEFKAPAAPLSKKAVTWPARAEGEKPVTVLELRAGRVQDVLPPSIHPDTRQPYTWRTPPRDGFPPLPETLLALWLNFDAFRLRARNRCPWAAPEEPPAPQPPRRTRPLQGPSVIAAFNAAHDPVAILEAHGYQRAGRRRWKSPNGHGIAGVVQLPSGKVYCHHESDVTLTEDKAVGERHALDAFDLLRILDHAGDYRAAVRAAAEALGLRGERAA
jgi:putative DNA primase/helicase